MTRSAGEVFHHALARAQAEILAAKTALFRQPDAMPAGVIQLDAFDEHLIEAVDAVLCASGAVSLQNIKYVLEAAAARHGFEIKPLTTT